jgi:hypothetical protein
VGGGGVERVVVLMMSKKNRKTWEELHDNQVIPGRPHFFVKFTKEKKYTWFVLNGNHYVKYAEVGASDRIPICRYCDTFRTTHYRNIGLTYCSYQLLNQQN